MIKVELTPQQAGELRKHYILELEKLQQRTAEILGLLKAIGQEPSSADLPVITPGGQLPSETGKPFYQPEKSKSESKPRRRGRPTSNPHWSEYVIEKLKEKNRPLTKEQIFKAYQKEHQVDLSASKSAMTSLNQAIQRLRVNKNLVRSIPRKGKRGNLYGLVTKEQPKSETKKTAKKVRAPREQKAPEQQKEAQAQNSKYNWPQFVIDTLNKTKRILSRKDFVNYALKEYSLPERDKSSVLGKISPVISHMVRSTKRLNIAKKKGQRGSFYGLAEWFDDDKKLIPDYK